MIVAEEATVEALATTGEMVLTAAEEATAEILVPAEEMEIEEAIPETLAPTGGTVMTVAEAVVGAAPDLVLGEVEVEAPLTARRSIGLAFHHRE